MPPQRVAVIFERFGPYHVARLEACSGLVETIGLELCAVDRTYEWTRCQGTTSFRRVTLFPEPGASSSEMAEAVEAALTSISPNAVAVPGWALKGCLAAIRWCVRRRVPIVLMADSQRSDRRRWHLQEWAKTRIVSLAGAGFVAGSRHVEYLHSLGMPLDRIFTGYDVVDNDHFRRKDGEVHTSNPFPRSYFLCVSRFVREKNLRFLLAAYAAYAGRVGDRSFDLVLAGDGPMRRELARFVVAQGIEGRVHFPGFCQYDALPALYARASALILPSTVEPWGLVVNEAMAAGLPVLVSMACGCAPDLIREGVNGHTFDPRRRHELARLMERLSSDSVDLMEMGMASQALIAPWSLETFATTLERAVGCAVKRRPPQESAVDRALLTGLLYR